MRQVCRQSPFESLPLTIEWSGRLFVTGSCMKATKTILPDQGPFPQNPQTGKERKKKQKRKKGCCYYRYTISFESTRYYKDGQLPDRPRTDPGVQFSRTGLFKILASAQGSARRGSQSHPWSYPWLGYLEVFQQLTEGFPTITLPLTPPVEPLSQSNQSGPGNSSVSVDPPVV